MRNLRAKLNKENGFTLVEMLIVVAIIAILIAISIPIVNKALERAREATDAANERAALGAAMIEVISENKLGGQEIGDTKVTAYYKVGTTGVSNASGTGVLVDTGSAGAEGFNYGKGTKVKVDSEAVHTNGCIKVSYDPTSTVTDESKRFSIDWETPSSP